MLSKKNINISYNFVRTYKTKLLQKVSKIKLSDLSLLISDYSYTRKTIVEEF